VFIAQGHGMRPWDLTPALREDIDRIYEDAKLSIWAELDQDFVEGVPGSLPLSTRSADRTDYILHPTTGEDLSPTSREQLDQLRKRQAGRIDVQIVVSDGLNALAVMEPGHLAPFLEQLHIDLADQGWNVSREHLVVTAGRVRAGYRIGEILFGGLDGRRAILHVIGERPGTGHRTFSSYITAAPGEIWARNGSVDHNITRVVSGVANTALDPQTGARAAARLLGPMSDRQN
jgi:ethanolamine ammonia-lyase large subunit